MLYSLLYVRHSDDQKVGKQREQTSWGMGIHADVVPAFLLPTHCYIRQDEEEGAVNNLENMEIHLHQQKALR